ncbi:FadR/GntR family transcriptional regulator [Taklimakanibacter albus]|uniref:FadR family transcriptional regulator n=1 Tax=Taklimakanibacter albus TaxID=2800327 RepID=A0ACC5QYY1_9HYPH|nr:FadR/GntR family transcriptional regulator [Aestuariivirga sp. YIM B02566]MBK1865578.1 FadR family transcriptional regulator [Aestuariivirga sp. YIM B02566]
MVRRSAAPKSSTLPDQIAVALRRDVESGKLQPGSLLPQERELAARFGVGLKAVRDGLGILRSEGLIVSGRNGRLATRDHPGFKLHPDFEDRDDLAQLIEFMISVESEYTALAASRRTQPELRRIKMSLDDLKVAVAENRTGTDEDMQFHYEILRASHNRHVIRFGRFLEDEVRRLVRTARTNTARYAGLMVDVLAEHQAIYDAIERRDVEAARSAAAVHLRNAGDRLKLYRGAGKPQKG